MLALGLQSKREITRIRVRTALAAQTREQGRYLAAARRTGNPGDRVAGLRVGEGYRPSTP